MKYLHFSSPFLKILVLAFAGHFSFPEANAKPPASATFYHLLEDPNQALPKAKSLLPTTGFRYETESHRLRIPRYMAYLLENEEFLNKFPEYRTLVPDFDKVITAANGHDIEKEPKHVYNKLAHDRGLNYDKMPPEEAAKAKAFRSAFNADGEAKIGKIMKSVGFIDDSGEINAKGRLFFTLEAFVDRWDAFKFRAQEFGKNMLRPGEYIRQVLKPGGFTTDHYNVDKVAELDDFVNDPKNKVNLEKAVGKVTPQSYKRVRNHFRGNSPSFSEIQREQASKLVAGHNEKVRVKSTFKMPSSAMAQGVPEGKATQAQPRGAKAASRVAANNAVKGIVVFGTAGAFASALHAAQNPQNQLGEAPNGASVATWNLGSSLLTGGAVNISELGDDMAMRYSDEKVYEDFLDLPLEEQEEIFRQNNTLAFRSVIFSKRPRIAEIQCSKKANNSASASQEPLEFDVYSPERRKIHMKIFFDNNKPMYLIGKLASPESSDDQEIRLSFQSDQACFTLPQYSKAQKTLVIKNECTTVNSKGLPNLEPERVQFLAPDYWGEMLKTRHWTGKYLSKLQKCCKSGKCLKVMNDEKYLASLEKESRNAKKENTATPLKGKR